MEIKFISAGAMANGYIAIDFGFGKMLWALAALIRQPGRDCWTLQISLTP